MFSEMNVTLGELCKEFSSLGLALEADMKPDLKITAIHSIEKSAPGHLVFVNKKEHLALVQKNRPSVLITDQKLKSIFADCIETVVLTTPQIALAQALIKARYCDRDFSSTGWNGVHPTAVIHETASVDPTVTIEPRVVVGKNSVIKKNSRIMAGVVIEHDVVIGENTIIHPNSTVGYGCLVGSNVNIESNTVIGSEGFGFAQDSKGKSHSIPQTGIVVIEDRVKIGASCAIDRAAYDETRIGAGTKLDNQCHIAHNVKIGEDCLLTAHFCVAGSTTIGNRVMASGHSGVLDHLSICDDVVLVHKAGVNSSIEKPGVYAGTPIQPLSDYMKTVVLLRNLSEMKQRLTALEKGN